MKYMQSGSAKSFFITKIFLLLIVITLFLYIVEVFAKSAANSAISNELHSLEKASGVRIGIYAINMANHQVIQYRASEALPLESTFKVLAVSALLKESEKNKELLSQKVVYTKDELVFWSPITEKAVRNGMTILELCQAAMMYSDNTAINLIVKKLGGPEKVNRFAQSIGDDAFNIEHWEPNLNSNPRTVSDKSTPRAMAQNLERLILGKALAKKQTDLLKAWMINNTTGTTKIRAGVPKHWLVADKTGSSNVYGVSNDVAVIWPQNCSPIIIAIYSAHIQKTSPRQNDIIASWTKRIIPEFAKGDLCLKKNI